MKCIVLVKETSNLLLILQQDFNLIELDGKCIYRLFLFSLIYLIIPSSFTQSVYVGSTPADPPVRTWINIPQDIKIDFIRWELNLNPSYNYSLKINYGEGQPNSPGFKNGGNFSTIQGVYKISGRNNIKVLTLTYKSSNLSFAGINENLIHLLTASNKLMVGNGGWSYTLNRKQPVETKQPLTVFENISIPKEDEIIFEGRTPCKELAEDYNITAERECLKLKWLLKLKRDKKTFEATSYTLSRTLERSRLIQGKWKIVSAASGEQIIELYSENGDLSVLLLTGDENVLFFISKHRKLFTGNKDFSYTLNRRL